MREPKYHADVFVLTINLEQASSGNLVLQSSNATAIGAYYD